MLIYTQIYWKKSSLIDEFSIEFNDNSEVAYIPGHRVVFPQEDSPVLEPVSSCPAFRRMLSRYTKCLVFLLACLNIAGNTPTVRLNTLLGKWYNCEMLGNALLFVQHSPNCILPP